MALTSNRSLTNILKGLKLKGEKSKIFKFLLYLSLWLFALTPPLRPFVFRRYKIYQAYIILWYCVIMRSSYLAFVWNIFGDEHSLNGFINILSYFTHMLGHFAVLAESWLIVDVRDALIKQFQEIYNRLYKELKNPLQTKDSKNRVYDVIAGVLILLLSGHGVIIWSTFVTESSTKSLYWRSILSYLALEFKTLEFLTGLMQINYFIMAIRQSINDLGERNLKRVFKLIDLKKPSEIIYVLSLKQEEEDEVLLKKLKGFYYEVYVLLKQYNEAYSLSLLASTAVYFVDFVCYSYWIVLAVLSQDRDYLMLLQNSSFVLMAFSLLSLICWFSEESTYESRYIGCLIAKLVKPLGNKSYNDLVSEFSIQTLHQRFVITAKEFFSLNLSLLGSMVAAIVTYLVILIQFMFTERNNFRKSLKTATYVNDTSTVEAIATTEDVTLFGFN